MRTPYSGSLGVLAPDHIDALNAVDLHLQVGASGKEWDSILSGPAILGVSDAEYSGAERIVDELDPERGDVLAAENFAWAQQWDRDTAVSDLEARAQSSPYFDPDIRVELNYWPVHAFRPDEALARPGGYVITRDAYEKALAEARQLRIVDPFHYAMTQADLKGVDALYADIEWSADLERSWRDGERGMLELQRQMASLERHHAMAEGLGDIALTMAMGAITEKPRLDYLVSPEHERPLGRLLHANNVRHEVGTLAPRPLLGMLENAVRDTAVSLGAPMRSADEIALRVWRANVEALRAHRTADTDDR